MKQPRRPCPDDGLVCGSWHRFWCWWWEWDATFVSRRALILVLVLFTAFNAYGFHRDQLDDERGERRDKAVAEVVMRNRANAERIEFESMARDYEACVESNRDKAGIVAYITALAGPPETRTDGAQEALDRAVEVFAPEECPPEPSPPGDGQ